jgi:transcriptional regulator
MYVPESFRVVDVLECHAVMRAHSFATLVTPVANGPPEITHLPVIVDSDRGPYGTLRGHLAKANGHGRAFADAAESIAVFQGPHGYISPRWYAANVAVPTWNYVAVHAYGRPEIVTDPAAIRHHLTELARHYEAGPNPWRVEELPGDVYQQLSASIVCWSMPITRLDGKAKLGQNRSAADQAGLLAGLDQLGTPAAKSLAEETRRFHETRANP